MRVFIKIRQLPNLIFRLMSKLMPIPVLTILTAALVVSGCGNKGDLFLVNSELLIQSERRSTPPIEDALDELEIMEIEEASASDVLDPLEEKEES